jgi:peptidoglycan/xylan/chitin deacetylase (PgdA/CDA1 family)
MTSIYMYHAVGNEQQIQGSDPHYAVTAEQFNSQIIAIATSIPISEQYLQTKQIKDHCITFDDGHLSNYEVAFPLLKRHGLRAEFYINTATVDTENFMTWEQLAEMNESGMSIQSHGHTHSYFSDMSEQQIELELETSKRLIEEKLNSKVIVFAPPGGRIDARVVRIAKALGYKCIATSRPGLARKSTFYSIPRFAIIRTTQIDKIESWKRKLSFDTLKEVIRYRVFRVAKIVLGNSRYERLRSKLLGDEGSAMS